jgi:hypothetical protein
MTGEKERMTDFSIAGGRLARESSADTPSPGSRYKVVHLKSVDQVQEDFDLILLCQNAIAYIMPLRSPGKRKIEEDNIDVAVQIPNRLAE